VEEIDDKSSELFGCPTLLIICSSAIRATEIIKSVSSKLIKCKIAKLFAKHFKLEEQIDMLSKEYFPIAIGTPSRLRKLIEYGALKLTATKVVLVDITPDVKQFNILTSNDVKSDFYPLLCEGVYPEKSHLKIALIRSVIQKS
jgi:protein CMS1